jgi:drug/metabolite transporter (DMT)-like permease
MEIKSMAYVSLMAAIVLGAFYPIALYVAGHSGINIFEFLTLGFALGTMGSLGFVFARGKQRKLFSYLINKKDLALLAVVGVLTHGFTSFGLLYAEKFISVPLATVVFRTQPLLMLLFLPIILRERVTRYQLVALVLAVVGVSIAVTGGSLSSFAFNNMPIFMLLMFVTVLDAVLPTIIKRYAYDLESSVFIFNAAACIFFLGVYWSYGMPAAPITLPGIGALAFAAVFFAFNPFFYYGALRRLKTTVFTNAYFISPFLTFLFSAALLGQALYPYYFAVVALTAIGIYIQSFDKRGGLYMAKSKAARQHISIYDVTSAFINTNADAVHDMMKGNGRVLAIKMDRQRHGEIKGIVSNLQLQAQGRSTSTKEGSVTLLYTHEDRDYISDRECSFVKDIMGVKEDEVVLMSAGAPEASESLFDRIASTSPESTQTAAATGT